MAVDSEKEESNENVEYVAEEVVSVLTVAGLIWLHGVFVRAQVISDPRYSAFAEVLEAFKSKEGIKV